VPATVQQPRYVSLGSWARGVLGLFGRRSAGGPRAAPPTEAPARTLASAEAGQLSALLRELARTPSEERRADWDAALVRGNTVGRYRLVRELGRGGFGRVWEAEDEAGGRVALKALKLGVHPGLREERLLQEADVAARLSHPAIVPVLDMGRCEHGPWLALELLRGETLAQRLRRAPLPPAEALRIARAVAGGVAHAHAQGVVHRDLKPGNVFVCEGGEVKLLDFGLAHAFGTVKAAGGTPGYMAPEQWRGAPEDERSDVFSLGVILHQLLSGALPFPEGAGEAVEAGGRAPALQVEGAPRLGRLVARMLARDPVERPRHGQEVLDELGRIDPRTLGEVRVLPAPRASSVRVSPQRARWLAGLGVAAALLAVGAVTSGPWSGRPPMRLPLPAQMRLAVLPFDEAGGGPAEAMLAAGLGELLTDRLRQLEPLRETLRVVAAQEIVREKVRSPREARSAFGATLALAGKLVSVGQRLRVEARLVDAETADLLAALDVDAARGDEQELERKLVARVAEALQLEGGAAGGKGAALGPLAAPGAYEFYLQGRGYLQRHNRVESLESAVSVFERALERDPGYALAWAGKAEAQLRRYRRGRDPRLLDEARSAALRAQELGESLAPVHFTLGLIRAEAGEHREAVQSFERALRSEPRNSDAARELANTLEAAGRYDEAEAAFRKAVELRPDSWAAYTALGAFCAGRGRFDEAAQYLSRVVELTPDNYAGYGNLGAVEFLRGHQEAAARALERSVVLRPTPNALANLGTLRFFGRRYDEAAALYQQAIDLAPADATLWANLGHARHHGGHPAEAREPYARAAKLLQAEIQRNPRDAASWSRLAMVEGASGYRRSSLGHIARALALQPRSGGVQFHAAMVYERAGQRDRALEAVRAALVAGHSLEELGRAPSLENLRRDPRYAAAVSRNAKPQ